MTVPSRSMTLRVKLATEWNHISRCTCDAHCVHVKPFVDTVKLRQWMQTVEAGEEHSNFKLVHDEIVHDKPGFYSSESTLYSRAESWMLVFSLLHRQYRGHLLPFFKHAGITDAELSNPACNVENLRRKLQRNKIQRADDIVADFEEERWEFCPFEFKFDSISTAQILNCQRRLPFVQVDKIAEGGQASVFKVRILADYVSKQIKEHLGTPLELNHIKCYEFAIKSFSRNQEHAFEAEGTAFEGLLGQPGFVQCFGRYEHPHEKPDNKCSYHILLELGKFSLVEYFLHFDPPVSTLAIICFWERLLSIAQAIHTFHDFRHSDEQYHGWHGDIKPDNILYIKDEWRLADFGFSTFKKASSEDSATAYLSVGITAYGPPELVAASPSDTRPTLTQAIDIWSFGCVLSVAATWAVHGNEGLEYFENLRLEAEKPFEGDAFHNGQILLTEILEWHQYLRTVFRRCDTISESILDIIETKMLIVDPKGRINPGELCRELQAVLDKARSNLVQGKHDKLAVSHLQQNNLNLDNEAHERKKSKFGSSKSIGFSSDESLRYRTRKYSRLQDPSPELSLQLVPHPTSDLFNLSIDPAAEPSQNSPNGAGTVLNAQQNVLARAQMEVETDASGDNRNTRILPLFGKVPEDVYQEHRPNEGRLELVEAQGPSHEPASSLATSLRSQPKMLQVIGGSPRCHEQSGSVDRSTSIFNPVHHLTNTNTTHSRRQFDDISISDLLISTKELSRPVQNIFKLAFTRESGAPFEASYATKLIQSHPDATRARDKNGRTPLMIAARVGNLPMLILLMPTSDLRSADRMGMTFFHHAILGVGTIQDAAQHMDFVKHVFLGISQKGKPQARQILVEKDANGTMPFLQCLTVDERCFADILIYCGVLDKLEPGSLEQAINMAKENGDIYMTGILEKRLQLPVE